MFLFPTGLQRNCVSGLNFGQFDQSVPEEIVFSEYPINLGSEHALHEVRTVREDETVAISSLSALADLLDVYDLQIAVAEAVPVPVLDGPDGPGRQLDVVVGGRHPRGLG
jgi:hypothetical protein